jgi:Mg2+ and Co2+ transporter CorA
MLFTRKAQESAQKAQESTDRMERITVDMHKIAKKTERETVSMGIITAVTLLFLPGTFMSVSHIIHNVSNLHQCIIHKLLDY